MKSSFSIVGIIYAATAALSAIGAQATWLDKPSIATYWGQNSKNGFNTQLPLVNYCDGNSDIIILSFTLGFRDGSLPDLNLANSCDGPPFPGTGLLECPDVGKDIKACQAKGKTILMSLGGANGNYGFANDANGRAFADTLWNIYGAGNSTTRPFGDAVLDGFDLDIEGGGPTGYAAMVTRLRSHFATDPSKRYYITGAPQCPFPDAMMGSVIDAVGFDAVNVQFYNNYCATLTSSFNFATWDNWAKNTSPNKNVKVLLGIPGSSTAAGSGYVPFGQLKPIVENVHKTYSSFGGVMVWDASQVYTNTDVSPNYAVALANLVHGLDGSSPPTTTTSASTTTVKTSSSSTVTSTSSKTTTTTGPTPTGTPGNCPVNGGACSVNGQYACAGNSFATCNHNTWSLRACPSGTTCFSTTDGASIYCGQGTAGSCPSPTAAVQTLEILRKPNVAATVGPIPKPYNSAHVTAQLSVKSATDSSFEAVINARRLDTTTFGKTVTVQFKVASNVEATAVENGSVAQRGSNVKITVQNDDIESKAILISISGRVTSGVFVAPNANTMTFA